MGPCDLWDGCRESSFQTCGHEGVFSGRPAWKIPVVTPPGWAGRPRGRAGAGTPGWDNRISLIRPGTAEQLVWGPEGATRDAGPPRVARTPPPRAGHRSEGRPEAQTSGATQTLTDFLGTRAPESSLPPPQGSNSASGPQDTELFRPKWCPRSGPRFPHLESETLVRFLRGTARSPVSLGLEGTIVRLLDTFAEAPGSPLRLPLWLSPPLKVTSPKCLLGGDGVAVGAKAPGSVLQGRQTQAQSRAWSEEQRVHLG